MSRREISLGPHLVDVGVGEVLAEEAHAGEGDEGEEVQRHQQVIRHGGGGDQGAVGVVLVGHSGEVHAAADVGAGHHGGHLGQALVIAEEAVDSEVGDQRAQHGAQGAAEEDRQHLAGLLPDLLEVALQQQQGDAHGADDAPDDVVVQNAVDGDDADVGHDHGQDQCDDGAGYLGSPTILLLQPD